MTAEIAVLNRNAVALAADSAVTLQGPEGPKIYNTNKLFALSKYYPLGIMVYGSAEFMGVPWETVIKLYRSKLGSRGFSGLEQYANDFFDFVERNRALFPPESQRRATRQLARSWVWRLIGRWRNEVGQRLQSRPRISERSAKSIFREIVADDIKHLRGQKNVPRFSRTGPASLLRRHGKVIRDAIVEELEDLRGVVPMNQLQIGCALAIVKDLYWHGESGVVIAGFGNSDVFPSLRCYMMDSIIGGRLRILEDEGRRARITTSGVTASVIAFAQSEMVALFMEGIDRDYRDFVQSFLSASLFDGYPSMLEKILTKLVTPRSKGRVLGRLRAAAKRLASQWDAAMIKYSRERHTDPIVDIVAQLPKEELAAMAEALVNLTSFKRHVTRQAETVGGPIDVAVISRGDGFIWIKRKHYFRPELNPQFPANYFRDSQTRT